MNINSKKILVVGAGFAGACYSRTLAEAGFEVDVIDKRSHIGGNAFDFINENGIRVHKYGPHLFHTSNLRVMRWLSRFSEWTPYTHRVRALLPNKQFVPIPINIDTIKTVFGKNFKDPSEAEQFIMRLGENYKNINNAADYLYSKIGKELTELFFRPYTEKMWAANLEEMDASVIKRIPIRFDGEDRYFPNDIYQALPSNGYDNLFASIFSHENIKIQLRMEFDKKIEKEYIHIFNSMSIDEYFNYSFGHLPYRSIKFHHRNEKKLTQHVWATTNFTDMGPFTRETCWDVLPNNCKIDNGIYAVTSEEPCDYLENEMERYYPVKTADGANEKLYELYKRMASDHGRITFIGRCGTYQYLNMDQVINQSLLGAHNWIEKMSHNKA